ncbi:GNAT family N-acetyltransferase [Actinomadura soli]|uniref:GNAT family N-acetyltransferase n=1 Tax=Actinomadura soli TaxID=2508997 RepID=UPI0022A6E4FF|nr:GNAT family protein [Actinomadura soli]
MGAGSLLGHELPGYFAGPELRHVWRLRLDQLTSDPASAPWSIHLAMAGAVAVGHGGFHGRPDATGTVEVGYSVDPAYRRRGHGKAILRELLRRAGAEPGVSRVRATIDRGNLASLASIGGLGFVRVAERGRELVFEASLDDLG